MCHCVVYPNRTSGSSRSSVRIGSKTRCLTELSARLTLYPDIFEKIEGIGGWGAPHRLYSGQQPARQLDPVAVDRVFIEDASGKDLERPQLAQFLAFVRPGDTVVVHSLDRLARNLEDLRQLVSRCTHQGVRVEFLHEQLTFTGDDSPMAQLMLSVMGAFAEFERALLRERQREGIALAKQRGVYTARGSNLMC